MPDLANHPRITWRRTVLVLGGTALVLGLAWLAWQRLNVTAPPDLDLTGVDTEIAQAIDKATADVRAKPQSAAAWGHLGMVLRAHEFGAEADVCFVQAETLDDQDPRWPYLRALTLLLSDREAAIALLERAAPRFGRNNTAPRLRLAEALLQQGRSDEAERHFRQVLAQDRDNPRAHLGLARLAHRRDAPRESEEHLRVASAHRLTQKSALVLRAEIRQQQGDADAAREDLRLAAELPEDPGWPDPVVEAVENLRVGLEARLVRAERLFHADRQREAVAELEELAHKAPKVDRVQLQLGQMFLRLGILDRAESAFRRLIALTPESAAAHFHLGNALALQEKHQQAGECYRRAIDLMPGHALAHYNLGHGLLRLGDRAGAATSFRNVLRFQPNHANTHINLGDLLFQEGMDAEALEHLEEAFRLSPSDERLLSLLAQVRKRLSAKKS